MFKFKSLAVLTVNIVAVSILAASMLHAGSPYVVSISSGVGAPGDTVNLSVTMDNNGGQIQGWSLGVCHDEAMLSTSSAELGATVLTIQDGDVADFVTINFEAGGITTGIVIDILSQVTLAPGVGFEILELEYDLTGAPGTAAVSFCEVLGSPPVSTVIVVNGDSVAPIQNNGAVVILNPNQLTIAEVTGILGDSVVVPVEITNVVAVDAAQCSIAYDSAVLTATNTSAAGVGLTAEFFSVQADVAGEVVFGLISDFDAPFDGNQLAIGTAQAIAGITFDISATAAAPSASPVTFVDGLGSPAIDNLLFVDGGTSMQPALIDGAVNIVNFNSFIRADCNSDSSVDIADGVFLINFLFASGSNPTCNDACDSNDDGGLDVADAIFAWNYLLLAGPAPSAPFPSAGLDPTTGDGIGCDGDEDDM